MEQPRRRGTRRPAGQTGQAAPPGQAEGGPNSNPNPSPQPDSNFPCDTFSADPKKTTPTPKPAKHTKAGTPNSGTHGKHSDAKKIRQEKQRLYEEKLQRMLSAAEARKRKVEPGDGIEDQDQDQESRDDPIRPSNTQMGRGKLKTQKTG